MAKVIIPGDRTKKQPVRCYCSNPECLEESDRKRFEFDCEHEQVSCPKCGANQPPMVGVLSLVHFLHKNPQGPVIGAGGIRYQLACDDNRAYLATLTNLEAATDQLPIVNCPGCLKAAADKNLKDRQGVGINPAMLQKLDQLNPG